MAEQTSEKPLYEMGAKKMEKAALAYFTRCAGEMCMEEDPATGTRRPVLDKDKRPVVLGQKPLTLTGLALALGFESVEQMESWCPQEESGRLVLEKARTRVEADLEERLFLKEQTAAAHLCLQRFFPRWRSGEEAAQNSFTVDIRMAGE